MAELPGAFLASFVVSMLRLVQNIHGVAGVEKLKDGGQDNGIMRLRNV